MIPVRWDPREVSLPWPTENSGNFSLSPFDDLEIDVNVLFTTEHTTGVEFRSAFSTLYILYGAFP